MSKAPTAFDALATREILGLHAVPEWLSKAPTAFDALATSSVARRILPFPRSRKLQPPSMLLRLSLSEA